MFDKVAIIGLGLLGGSLARDLQRHGLARRVVGVCRSSQTAELAMQENVVDEVCDLEAAIDQAGLIVLATPMQSMLPLLESVHQQIPASAIITDVGSVKSQLYADLKKSCPELLSQFVLAHPIAGGEDSGVAASRLDLFAGKHVIITDTDEVHPEQVQAVSAMWQHLGAQVMNMSLQQHDAIFAKTSHLPHVVAYTLVNYLSAQGNRDQLFEMAAAGFYDFSRIASSNAEMWRDICMTNREEVLSALDGFQQQIGLIRHKIAQHDQQGIYDAFAAAKVARDAGLEKKGLAK